ncbi:Cro/CI family transcriptional regulator [Idiomarina xiamenensis]|uniref:Phage transcriptional regulator, Cro-like protein n=1 Tax=Idiomarina xiamenensis 10-D-4 TaxID=740709 RepID=K2K8X0_9GAMM|nr:Cro/CI family transcriptional regulator [Idiomarina xiamenensis]EKE79454.1 phage transcriptional regulator, Cro-like protein [Idiomarina xiamenensis 10-D-4]
MTKIEAIKYFGSQRNLAAVLGKTEGAVSQWKRIPRGVQFELQVRTGGKLSVDTEYTNQPFNQRIETDAAA